MNLNIDRLKQNNLLLNDIDGLTNQYNSLAALNTTGNITQSVQYYGAVGDGVTDDTLAIQNCINANNEYIYLYSKSYRITSTLLIDTKVNFTIVSDGAEIIEDITTFGNSAIHLKNTSNFTITGNLDIRTNSTVDITPTLNQSCNNAIKIEGCVFVSLQNLRIQGAFNYGIWVIESNFGNTLCRHISHIRISKCNIGIYAQCEYYAISNCELSLCRIGVKLDTANTSISNCNIVGNRIGISTVINAANSDHSFIADCTINHNSLVGILFDGININFRVSNCSLMSNGADIQMHNFLPNTLTVDDFANFALFTLNKYNLIMNNCSNLIICSCAVTGAACGFNGLRFANISKNTFSDNMYEYGGSNYYCRVIDNIFNAGNSVQFLTDNPAAETNRFLAYNDMPGMRSVLDSATGTIYLDPNCREFWVNNNTTAPVSYVFRALGGTFVQNTYSK